MIYEFSNEEFKKAFCFFNTGIYIELISMFIITIMLSKITIVMAHLSFFLSFFIEATITSLG